MDNEFAEGMGFIIGENIEKVMKGSHMILDGVAIHQKCRIV